MKWIETKTLPRACIGCQEKDCYNCDVAGERWIFSQRDNLRVRRKGLLKAMERMQRELAEIDRELSILEK